MPEQTNDILVVVDVKKSSVQMWASDDSIVLSGNGTKELYVNIPVGDNIRWTAVPLQATDGSDANLYSVIITDVKLWGANSQNNQTDAYPYLNNWLLNNGDMTIASYTKQGDLTQNYPWTAHNDGSHTSGPFATATLGDYSPFVQCTTQLNDRDTPFIQKVAYTFTVKIYMNGQDTGKTITWDPFVRIYREGHQNS